MSLGSLRKRRKRKKQPPPPRAPVLSIAQILRWADEYHARTDNWPKRTTGVIAGSLGETWYKVDKALRNGTRGLPGGSSLARLLEEQRGVRNLAHLPPLTIRQVLGWADAHFQSNGAWPHKDSGPVIDHPGETWMNVDAALRQGLRGLPAGGSLARLLARHRKVVNGADRPRLTEEQVLKWARRFRRRMNRWPTRTDGAIPESPGDTWLAIDTALHRGTRGLPGGSSLAQLLAQECGVRNRAALPPLTEDLILTWLDSDRAITGVWARPTSGPVLSAPGETWGAINKALAQGHRCLPGGSSLAELLTRRRGVRNNWHLPELTEALIFTWMKALRDRKGHWPTAGSGPVEESPQDTWRQLDAALRKGRRGLPGGSSLARLASRAEAQSR
jgi:hypothetical protein